MPVSATSTFDPPPSTNVGNPRAAALSTLVGMLEEEYEKRRQLPRHLRKQPEPERPFAFDIRSVEDRDIPDIREIYNYYVTNSVVTFDEKKWSIAQWRDKKVIWWRAFRTEAEALEAAGLRE